MDFVGKLGFQPREFVANPIVTCFAMSVGCYRIEGLYGKTETFLLSILAVEDKNVSVVERQSKESSGLVSGLGELCSLSL